MLALIIFADVFTYNNICLADYYSSVKTAIAEEPDQTVGETTNQRCSISRVLTIEQHRWVEKDIWGVTVGVIFTPTATPVPNASSFWNHVRYVEDVSYQKTEYAQGNMIMCPGDAQNCTVHKCDATFE